MFPQHLIIGQTTYTWHCIFVPIILLAQTTYKSQFSKRGRNSRHLPKQRICRIPSSIILRNTLVKEYLGWKVPTPMMIDEHMYNRQVDQKPNRGLSYTLNYFEQRVYLGRKVPTPMMSTGTIARFVTKNRFVCPENHEWNYLTSCLYGKQCQTNLHPCLACTKYLELVTFNYRNLSQWGCRHWTYEYLIHDRYGKN